MNAHERGRLVIAALVTVGFFTLIGTSLFVEIKGAELQLVDTMVGVLATAFSLVVAFYVRKET